MRVDAVLLRAMLAIACAVVTAALFVAAPAAAQPVSTGTVPTAARSATGPERPAPDRPPARVRHQCCACHAPLLVAPVAARTGGVDRADGHGGSILRVAAGDAVLPLRLLRPPIA